MNAVDNYLLPMTQYLNTPRSHYLEGGIYHEEIYFSRSTPYSNEGGEAANCVDQLLNSGGLLRVVIIIIDSYEAPCTETYIFTFILFYEHCSFFFIRRHNEVTPAS